MTADKCNCPACRERRRVVGDVVARIEAMQAKRQEKVERSSGDNHPEVTPK